MIAKRLNVSQMLGIAVIAVLAWPLIAGAQSFPRLKPIPPKKGSPARAAIPADPSSPWQTLPNQPPVLD